jgi:RimJ/RimL family protein N-acetyltransferase
MVRIRHVADDGTAFTFREPTAGDTKQLMSFINSFIDEPMSGILMNKKVTLRSEKAWLDGQLREIRARSVFILLAEMDGRVVGSCHISRLPSKHSHRASIGVALVKDVRGRGLGEALMRKTIEAGSKRIKGLECIELSTFAYNERAQSLYKKLGFREFGRIPRAMKEGQQYFDELLMRLELAPPKRGRKRSGA